MEEALVVFNGRSLPAELVILFMELSAGENGVWLNSRQLQSGVVDLIASPETTGSYVTRREPLPSFVAEALKRLYQATGVKRGCPDLVIWNVRTRKIRLVEVKCPHWDRPTKEQELFLRAAQTAGVPAKIVEWEFRGAI